MTRRCAGPRTPGCGIAFLCNHHRIDSLGCWDEPAEGETFSHEMKHWWFRRAVCRVSRARVHWALGHRAGCMESNMKLWLFREPS